MTLPFASTDVHNQLAGKALLRAFDDFYKRVGDEAMCFKSLVEQVADLFSDIYAKGAVVTGCREDGYLSLILHMVGEVLISRLSKRLIPR